ncbi:MAG: RteC domain-containing protein [Flavobacteriaceae bacterium]|nr:RteC domain-containing protein [Flavobacteriaceae bacterium]
MKTNLFKVLDDFEQHLSNLSIEVSPPLKCFEKSLLYAIQVLNDLKIEIVNHDFIDNQDEINFFKNIKPQLTSKAIYINTLYQIEPHISLLSTNKQQEFYKRELFKLQIFFEDNKDFYHYYKMKHTHFDIFYFLRNKHNIRLNLDAYLINSDLQFSTSHDYKLALIMANETLYFPK